MTDMTNTPYGYSPYEIGSIHGQVASALDALRAIASVYPHLRATTEPAIVNLECAEATITRGIERYEKSDV
jgi:hypothetical protein